jgi:hypothetical protein
MSKNQANLSMSGRVRYRTFAVNPDGSEVKLSDHHNLILNVGLDMVYTYPWANCTDYVALGEGNTPVKRDSGATQFSRAGNTVTADNAFFEAADVGRLLKFDSGEEMTVTAFTDAMHVTVGTAGALAASQATIWYVNEIGHQTEFMRFNTKSTSAGENGSTFFAGTWTHKKTFLSGTFGANKVVREIGWSPLGADNLFGRDLVPAGGDSVTAGQKYKVVVELSVTYTPQASTVNGDVGNNGFNTAGHSGIEYCKVCQVQSNGGVDGPGVDNYRKGKLEVGDARPMYMRVSTSAGAIAPITNNPVNHNGDIFSPDAIVGKSAYTSGSYTCTMGCGIGENDAVSTNIRSILISDGSNSLFRTVFDNPQTKDTLHTLSFTWRFNWGRTLVN